MRKTKIDHIREFIIVLIGILIAFQLNKYGEDQARDKLIMTHFDSIQIESKTNIQTLKAITTQNELQIRYCDSLLTEISLATNPLAIRNFSMKLLDLRSVELNKNAYEVLIQSGDIRFVKDYEVKKNIISMYDSFNRITQINQSNLNLYDTHFYPYLKNNFDLVNWQKLEIQSPKEEKVYYSKEFANIVSTYRFLLMAKQRIYRNEQKIIEEYLESVTVGN